MKRVFLAMLLVLAAVITQAQDVYTVRAFTYGPYNTYKKSYEFQPVQEVSSKITIHGNVLLVDDKAHSTYRILPGSKTNIDDGKEEGFMWDALDEKDRPVVVMMTRSRVSNIRQIIILYKLQAYVYFLD